MRRLLLGFLIVAAAGCLNEDVVGSKTATGTYTLRTLNGSSLPYTTPAPAAVEVLDATLNLYQGGTYAETKHVRVTDTQGQTTTQTREDAGSYSFFDITVTFTSSVGNGERRGKIEANNLTIVENGLTWVYRK